MEKCFVLLQGNSKSTKSNEIDLITLGRNMKQLLDSIHELDQITHVIIENQISPIASRMKTIQGMLAQYFIMKLDLDVTITFVSSRNKLKDLLLRENQNKEEKEKDKYKSHKKDAIIYTQQILETNTNLHSWIPLLSCKKKDDLADCFLQGIWYIKSKI